MHRLQALAMGISAEHRAWETGSDAFRYLNPGLLVNYIPQIGCRPPIHTSEEGYRIFTCFNGGYYALVSNLRDKCAGKSRAKGKNKALLTSNSTLAELCNTFRHINCRNLVEFLRDALDDSAITERTPIGFFIEETNVQSGQ